MILKINLASRSYVNRRQFNGITIAAFAVLGVALLLLIQNVASNAGDLVSTGREIAQLEGKDSGKIPQKDYQEVLARIKFANEIIRKKSFSWIALLDKLERVVPDGIAISTIEPNTKTQELTITGAGRGFRNVRQLMENLESSGDFRDVFLVNQAEVKVGQTQQGITFTINSKVTFR